MNSEAEVLQKIDVDPAIRALIPNYLRRRVSDIEVIRTLLAQNNMKEIRRLAHNMRGSGLAYGMPLVSEIGESMEEAAIAFDVGTIHSLTLKLEQFVESVS